MAQIKDLIFLELQMLYYSNESHTHGRTPSSLVCDQTASHTVWYVKDTKLLKKNKNIFKSLFFLSVTLLSAKRHTDE